MGKSKRPDISVEAVMEMWFSGMSRERIANEMDATVQTISRKIARAREMFPDLDWDGRRPVNNPGAVSSYLSMRDGKQGEREVPDSLIGRSDRTRRE